MLEAISAKPCERSKTSGMQGKIQRMDVNEFTPEMLAKFWMKVKANGGCWEWQNALTNGYGTFAPKRFAILPAHRVAYELIVGPIPEGLELDHLCKNPRCVNPNHLEPVTHAENCRRGDGFGGRNFRKTHCKNGHPLDGPNLYLTTTGKRQCRACRAEQAKAFRERNPGYHAKWKATRAQHDPSHGGVENAA